MSMQTANFGMTKDASADYYNIDTVNENLDKVDAALGNTAKFETAGGTATAITLTGITLATGNSKTFIAAYSNLGSTTTINGLPLYKPGTTTVPNIIVGKAYTVWYDATNNCFFIKASAEGDAVVGNVLAGKKFSNDDDTGLTGTMAENGPVASETISLTDNNQEYTIATGHHTGLRKIKATITNLAAAAIAAGVTVGGIVGTYTSDATATAALMFAGLTAYVNGSKLTGTGAPKVPNLLKDGSFENNGICWSIAAPSAISNTYFKFTSKCLMLAATNTSSPSVNTQVIAPVTVGHIYYACGWYYRTAALSQPSDIQIVGGTSDMNFYSISNTTIPTIGTWAFISGLATGIANSYVYRHYTYDTVAIYADGLMLIDLTAVFGSGKEPTKAQMDAIVQAAGGWWDSDLTLLTTDATATAAQILNGYTAYVNGTKLTGSIINRTGNHMASAVSADGIGYVLLTAAQGYYDGSTGKAVYYDADFIANNIAYNKEIFGLTGTHVFSLVAGDNDFLMGEASVLINKSDGAVYINEWTPPVSGTVRIYFGLYTTSTNVTAIAQIMQGSAGSRTALGTFRSTNSTTPVYYTEDVSVTAGVPISLYCLCSYATSTYIYLVGFAIKTTIQRNSLNGNKQTT